MGILENAFKRELGKNAGKVVSNIFFGDKWSTPYRRTDVATQARADAIKARADARASIDNARADAIEQRELNAIDAAVIRNVDAVISSEVGNTPEEMVKFLSGLCIQLETNNFDHESREDAIRAKYTKAVLTKMKFGIRQLEYADPLNPHLDEFIRVYYKAVRRKWRAAASWKIWFFVIILLIDIFAFMALADDAGEGGALVVVLIANAAFLLLYLIFLLLFTICAKLTHKIRRKNIYRSTVLHNERIKLSQNTAPISNKEETIIPQKTNYSTKPIANSHYRKEFIELLNDNRWEGAYLGQGNPNAKILIVGREHGFDNAEQRVLEIDNNWEQWTRIINGDETSESGYTPRHCYAERGQQWKIAPTTGGTSATWFVYQKFVNSIIPHNSFMRKLDFFEYSFITEFSTVNRGNNSQSTEKDIQATADSIAERTPLLSTAFYRSFPIVILSCGDYFDQYHINIERMFDVKWEGRTREVMLGNGKKAWMNMHYSSDRKRIVIHTWQASALTHGSEDTYQPFFNELAKLSK